MEVVQFPSVSRIFAFGVYLPSWVATGTKTRFPVRLLWSGSFLAVLGIVGMCLPDRGPSPPAPLADLPNGCGICLSTSFRTAHGSGTS